MWHKISWLLLGTLALCGGAFGAAEGTDDIVKLQQAAVGDDVLTAFAQGSPVAYDLSADDIQRLEDAKVPATVIVAMLDKGKQTPSEPAAQPLSAASPASPASSPVTEEAPSGPSAEVAAPAPGQANISTFYGALAPYGTWSQDAGNGWVWEPTEGVSAVNWRPYASNGHWLWTDQGWYWESDSPYGWATFHYGRWGYNSRHRWSWVPDNVWGPAWVDWRQSEDHFGWAPLPFGSRFEAGVGVSFHGKEMGFDFHAGLDEGDYSFVPCGNFLDLNLGLVLEPEGRSHDFYTRTRVVNNTYVYNNNRIINNGVSTTMVERATNRKLERVSVVDANIAAGQPIRGEHRNGNTIVAYRPKLANVAPVEPPVMVARQKAAAARVSTAVKADDHKTSAAGRLAAEQNALRRLTEEKAQRRDKTTNAAGLSANKEAATERNSAAEEKVREAKAKATGREKASANKDSAVERGAVNPEAATERKAAAEEKVREARTEATGREKASANQESAAERGAANQEAATERKAAAEISRESKQNAAEEKPSSNRKVAPERKAAPEPSREPQREERESAKEESGHERK